MTHRHLVEVTEASASSIRRFSRLQTLPSHFTRAGRGKRFPSHGLCAWALALLLPVMHSTVIRVPAMTGFPIMTFAFDSMKLMH